MQAAGVVAGAATWRTGRNKRVIFDSGLFPALYENMTSSTKPEYITVRGGLSHVHV